MNTYTATFANGTTYSKNSKSKRGFPFAALITAANGSYSVSFSSSRNGLMNSYHRNIQAAKEIMENETNPNTIKDLENDIPKTIEIVETAVS